MGSVGFPEVMVILVLALLVLGPERLPQAARTMGRWVAEIRKITGTLQAEVQDVVDEVMRPVNETATVASDSFTSTYTTADSGAAAVEAEPGTAASPSLASSEAWPAEDDGPLAADVPLPSSFPAPPVDPSLN